MNTPRLIIPVFFPIITTESRELIAEQLIQAKCDTLLFSMPEFFGEGEAKAALMEKIRDMRIFFEGKGLHVCVWTSTLGYSGKRDADFQNRFANCMRIKNTAGQDNGDTICLTDRTFRDFICGHICDIADTGVTDILLDDDFTLSGRNAAVCTCENHLAAFGQRIGREVRREEVATWFAGSANPMRTAYLDAQEESILDFCRELRQKLDKKAGRHIRVGLCATYTGYDLESRKIEEIVRTLAGDNPPLLRMSGAPFWSRLAPRLFDGMALGSVVEFIRFQESFLRDSGIQCSFEDDPWPRQRRLVPSAWMECYDKMLLTTGWINRQKYMMRYSTSPEYGENGYWEHHCHNLKDEGPILRMFEGKRPVGLRVHFFRDIVRKATYPAPYENDYTILSLSTQPRAGDFAFENSIPTSYEGNQPGIVFWEHARLLTDAQIRGGLILDLHAARILTERGYDVGLRGATPLPKPPLSERFMDDPENVLRLEDPNGTYYAMETAPGAEIVSRWQISSEEGLPSGAIHHWNGKAEVASCYVYTNPEGARFAVYAFDAGRIRYSMPLVMPAHIPVTLLLGRDRQIASLYRFLSDGGELPVTCFKHPQLYILASRDQTRLAVMLCNMFPDPVIRPILNLDADYEVIDSTSPDVRGQRSDNRRLRLDTVIPAYHYLCIELQRQNPPANRA